MDNLIRIVAGVGGLIIAGRLAMGAVRQRQAARGNSDAPRGSFAAAWVVLVVTVVIVALTLLL